MEVNNIQNKLLSKEYKKTEHKANVCVEEFNTAESPSNPEYYEKCKGISFKGHPFIADVKDSEKTKNVKLDDENYTVKSYKKNDNEFILTDEGKLYRLKYSKNKEKNAETVLASKLYNLAGVKTPDMKVYESEHGMNGYVSEHTSTLAAMESNPKALYEAFGADAWLGNWNTFSHDNTGIDSDGNAVKLVTSGSLSYRASGKKKDKFDGNVDELQTMRDSATNPKGAELLKNMSDEDLKSSLQKVSDIKQNDIILAVKQSQVSDKQNMIDTLLERQKYIKSELDKLTPKVDIYETEQDYVPDFSDPDSLAIEPKKFEKVTPEIRARRKEQLNKYLQGGYIYINKDEPDRWYTNYQKENIAKVKQELEHHPAKREFFEDILDTCFWEYKGNRSLVYERDLHQFVNYPEDRLKTIAHLATFKEQGYSRPINSPESYNKLSDIPNDKLNYMVYKCNIKTVDGLLEMDKKSFESMKISMNLGEKYGIKDNLVNNIIKFATDETGNIPKYKQDAMDKLLQKSDEFKKPYTSCTSGGPTCLLSSVIKLCDSEEKTDYILNTVLPMYDEIVPEYDQNSQYDIANLSKDNKDTDFELERIKFLKSHSGRTHDYWVMLNYLSGKEELDIYKDCLADGMDNYYALQTLFHSRDYDSNTDKKQYDYDSISFSKKMYKDDIHKIGVFNDYLLSYNYNKNLRQNILADVEKIKERGLTEFILSDRKPFSNSSYYPSDRKRNLMSEEVNLLKDLPLEKLEKLKQFIEIPERGRYNQFPIDQLIEFLDMDETNGNKIEKFGLFNSALSAEQIMVLANMNDSTLQEMENRGILKTFAIKRDTASYDEVASYFDNLDESGWDKAEKRFFKNDDISAQLDFEQYKSLINLKDDVYNRVISNELFDKHGVDTTFQYIDMVEYENASNINELPSAQKRTLLKKLVKYNKSLFTNPIIDFPVIPKNQEQYCATMQNLVNSIGLRYKPINNEVKTQYFKTLENLENIHGEFMNTDFTRVGAELELVYPRKDFLKDIDKHLDGLSEKDRAKVTNYFGFEYREYRDGSRKMNGYPVDNDSDVFNSEYNCRTSDAIRNIRPFVKRFSEGNDIIANHTITPTLARELSNITRAFPEWNTIVGKKQHKTHDYDVDIHSLNVLQNIMKNPRYRYLPESDRRALQTVALFHDLTKLEGDVDKTHPDYSAFDAYHLIKKLGMKEDKNLQIYQLIKNHDFNEKYTPSNAKDYAYEFRQGNNFLMECIMSEADLKSVARNGSFYNRFGGKLKEAESNVSKYVDHIQKTGICLPQTKLPKASELRVNGNTVQEKISYDSNGNLIKNKVIYLQSGMNLKDIGFKEDTKAEDFNVLVHGLDNGEQSAIFNALGQVDSDALLSTSYVNYGKGNYHVFRQQGFILDVAGDDIGAGYFRDFGSGYGKNLSALKKDYLFGSKTEFRDYMPNALKKELNISDEEYKKLYTEIADKSITELDKEKPEVANAIRKMINDMEDGKRRHGRSYNEILVARPKIQGVFYQGVREKDKQEYKYEDIPVFLREYAANNDVPIIYWGK